MKTLDSYRKIAFDNFKPECNRCKSKRILNVHHRDHNRNNNSINNLEILCKSCHNREHYKYSKRRVDGIRHHNIYIKIYLYGKDNPGWKGGKNIERNCKLCSNTFLSYKCQNRSYCSLKCAQRDRPNTRKKRRDGKEKYNN